MGYTTTFVGELKFGEELKGSQIAYLSSILNEDRRDHPEWNAPDDFYYVDLELTENYDGLRWSGAEKTYGMVAIVNTVIKLMQEKWPDFTLQGKLNAQGEDVGDVWLLYIDDDGLAKQKELKIEGQVIECPHCSERFVLEDKYIQ